MRASVVQTEKGRKTHPHKSATDDLGVVVRACCVLLLRSVGDRDILLDDVEGACNVLRRYLEVDDGEKV